MFDCTFLIFFNDRLATRRRERYFKGNFALFCGQFCSVLWANVLTHTRGRSVKKGLYERFLFPHFNLSLVVEDDDDDERDDDDEEKGKEGKEEDFFFFSLFSKLLKLLLLRFVLCDEN